MTLTLASDMAQLSPQLSRYEDMSIRRSRRKVPAILALSQHWRIVDGTVYRDCTVRTVTGEIRVMGVRDELLGGEL